MNGILLLPYWVCMQGKVRERAQADLADAWRVCQSLHKGENSRASPWTNLGKIYKRIPDVLLFPCHNQLWPFNELEKTQFEDEMFDEDEDLIEFLLLNNGFQPILPLVDDNFELRFLGLEIAPNLMNVFIVWKKKFKSLHDLQWASK